MRAIALAGLLAILGGPAPLWAGVEASALSVDAILEGLALHSEELVAVLESSEYEVQTVVKELDSDGELEMIRKLHDRITQKEGKPEATLLSATEDGEDILEKTKAKRAERRKKAEKKAEESGKKRGDFPNPFRGTVQKEYRFELLSPSKRYPEALRIAFGPKDKPKKELFVGQAIIDPVKKRMLQLTARPSKYSFGLDEMFFSVSFGELEGRPIIRSIFGKGKGGLPLMKRRFEFRTAFEAWKLPAPPIP